MVDEKHSAAACACYAVMLQNSSSWQNCTSKRGATDLAREAQGFFATSTEHDAAIKAANMAEYSGGAITLPQLVGYEFNSEAVVCVDHLLAR